MPERADRAGPAGPTLMASGLGVRLALALAAAALVWLVILGSLR